jgi:hypothetical protein
MTTEQIEATAGGELVRQEAARFFPGMELYKKWSACEGYNHEFFLFLFFFEQCNAML